MMVLLIFNSCYNVYELSPKVCKVMLGTTVTPGSFVANRGEGTTIANAYTYAKVNRKGNLILVLSNSERDAWKNSEVVLQILSILWETKKDIGVEVIDTTDDVYELIIRPGLGCGLELSEDYTKVISEPNDDSFYYQWFILMGINMQFFEGVPSDEIYVEYIEYNSNGEVCKRLAWPDDEKMIWPDNGD
jgi:hypothetical protein